uniref:Uncharacterized protein n=1 Tax=viral metagenome TaxID=1070528 RepID=A0A6C0FA32_9ZZZZ|tara:strand:+ start:10316 stop:11503 length:1188 start_codon:yes stop_codon:yes gene_type:complete
MPTYRRKHTKRRQKKKRYKTYTNTKKQTNRRYKRRTKRTRKKRGGSLDLSPSPDEINPLTVDSAPGLRPSSRKWCLKNSNCPQGERCELFRCVNDNEERTCLFNFNCPGNQKCVNRKCVDDSSDIPDIPSDETIRLSPASSRSSSSPRSPRSSRSRSYGLADKYFNDKTLEYIYTPYDFPSHDLLTIVSDNDNVIKNDEDVGFQYSFKVDLLLILVDYFEHGVFPEWFIPGNRKYPDYMLELASLLLSDLCETQYEEQKLEENMQKFEREYKVSRKDKDLKEYLFGILKHLKSDADRILKALQFKNNNISLKSKENARYYHGRINVLERALKIAVDRRRKKSHSSKDVGLNSPVEGVFRIEPQTMRGNQSDESPSLRTPTPLLVRDITERSPRSA